MRKPAWWPRANRCGCAYRELTARLTAEERLDAAQRMLEDAAGRCPSAESTTALAQRRGELDAQRQAVEAHRARQEAAAQDAYRARLRTRYQRATDAGDAPAAARYKDLLSAAGASTE